MIAAGGGARFGQVGIAPVFAQTVTGFDAPAMRDGVVPVARRHRLLVLAVPGQLPMRLGWLVALRVKLRAPQVEGDELSFVP